MAKPKPWNEMDEKLQSAVNEAISNAGATEEFAEWILRGDHATRLVDWMLLMVAGEIDPVYDEDVIPECPSVNLVCSTPDVLPGPCNKK